MNTKKKLIYISGKMGEMKLSDATIEKFRVAQDRLVNEGWAVINPANDVFQREAMKHVKAESRKWKDLKVDLYARILLLDMHYLALCDTIYMLKDWRYSPGAIVEHAYAVACKKPIIYEEL